MATVSRSAFASRNTLAPTNSVTVSSIRVLLAPLKNLWVAIPMTAVRKIMRTADVLSPGKSLPQYIQVDDLATKVINLYEQIYGSMNPDPESHLVALEMPDGQGFSIPLTKLPTILDIDTTTIRSIPADYRDLYLLDVASHITLLQQGKTEITVFLIDPEKLRSL
jgi:hypothetical protein